MKIRFNSDDNLPLKQELQMHNVVITIRSVFLDNNKHYPQVFLGKCNINWLNRSYHVSFIDKKSCK